MIDHDRSIWETISRYNVPIKNKLLEFRMEFRISCWDLGPSRSLVHLTFIRNTQVEDTLSRSKTPVSKHSLVS